MVCDAGGSTVDITTYNLQGRGKSIHLDQVKASCGYLYQVAHFLLYR